MGNWTIKNQIITALKKLKAKKWLIFYLFIIENNSKYIKMFYHFQIPWIKDARFFCLILDYYYLLLIGYLYRGDNIYWDPTFKGRSSDWCIFLLFPPKFLSYSRSCSFSLSSLFGIIAVFFNSSIFLFSLEFTLGLGIYGKLSSWGSKFKLQVNHGWSCRSLDIILFLGSTWRAHAITFLRWSVTIGLAGN